MYTKTVYFISQIATLKMGFRAVYFITPVYFISTVYFISPPPVELYVLKIHTYFFYFWGSCVIPAREAQKNFF